VLERLIPARGGRGLPAVSNDMGREKIKARASAAGFKGNFSSRNLLAAAGKTQASCTGGKKKVWRGSKVLWGGRRKGDVKIPS